MENAIYGECTLTLCIEWNIVMVEHKWLITVECKDCVGGKIYPQDGPSFKCAECEGIGLLEYTEYYENVYDAATDYDHAIRIIKGTNNE